jgi:hypothetical protein
MGICQEEIAELCWLIGDFLPERRGTYMALEQCVYITPETQGAIFGFPRK